MFLYEVNFLKFFSSVAPRRDELFVSTGSGLLQRVNWHGLLEGEMNMSIHSIPFTNDLENARGMSVIVLFLQKHIYPPESDS